VNAARLRGLRRGDAIKAKNERYKKKGDVSLTTFQKLSSERTAGRTEIDRT
jgi:hypothetical protein